MSDQPNEDADIFDAIAESEAVTLLTNRGYTVIAPGQASAGLRDPQPRKGRKRRGDHATSAAGAEDVAYRAGSQKARLLREYGQAIRFGGLTDEEAATYADLLGTCYWKRCGELREDGMVGIVTDGTDQPVTRLGWAGVERIVCRITPKGSAALRELEGTT